MPTQCGIQWLTFISCFKAWDRRLCFEKFMVHMWEENNLAYSKPAAQQDVQNVQHSIALGREN